jgi:aspartyl-tRNA(Asn)/glutamyl-tRNA(Gln) amidotransferase subunit A
VPEAVRTQGRHPGASAWRATLARPSSFRRMGETETFPAWPPVVELADSVRRGERKATELLDEALERIAAGNERLNAFVHLDEGIARAAASAVDTAVARGEDPGPLAGVPLGVKDLHDCAGMPTSHGSLWFKGGPPAERDDVDVARLRGAGAVPVGKTAAPEFGILNFARTKAWGVTRNPWNPERTPGGSSSGSAAAVAAGIIPLATASDGGGSIRIPAAFCGLVGHKPSHGRVPHPGPMHSQTSVVGVVATTVADAARCLDVQAGPDERDRLSLPPSGVRYEEEIERLDVGGLRARWSLDLGFVEHVDPEVAELSRAAAETLAEAAGLVLDDEPVHLADATRVWMSSGVLSSWTEEGVGERWPSRAEELMPYTRQGFETSQGITAERIGRMHRRRYEFELSVSALFDEIDVLLLPSTAVPAFAAAGPPPGGAMSTPFTMLANLCWNPATQIPAGLTSDGLPVGVQVVARRHRDDICLRLARILEQTQPWPRVVPRRTEGSARS